MKQPERVIGVTREDEGSGEKMPKFAVSAELAHDDETSWLKRQRPQRKGSNLPRDGALQLG
jgi:hypothetical protein